MEQNIRRGCNPTFPTGNSSDILAAQRSSGRAARWRRPAITHAFEGGHPDHDACALILDAARRTLENRDVPSPKRLEFSLYQLEDGSICLATFRLGEPQGCDLTLTEKQQARKRVSLSAFTSQRHVVDHFPLTQEHLRSTPLSRDFLAPRSAQSLLFAAKNERRAEE